MTPILQGKGRPLAGTRLDSFQEAAARQQVRLRCLPSRTARNCGTDRDSGLQHLSAAGSMVLRMENGESGAGWGTPGAPLWVVG